MTEVVLILLGWILGVLGSLITWRAQRFSDLREVHSGMVAEADELRYRLAVLAVRVALHIGQMDKELLEWYESTTRGYSGPLPHAEFDERISKIRSLPADKFASLANLMVRPADIGLGIKPISAFAIPAGVSSLSSLGPSFQRHAYDSLRRIDELNHEIATTKELHDRTFDGSLSDENHEVVTGNLRNSYSMILKMCRWTADSLTQLTQVRLSRKLWNRLF